MCRIPNVVVVAPSDRRDHLQRALSSLEYQIVAAVGPGEDPGLRVDVAVLWEPGPADVDRARTFADKVVAVGPEGSGADMRLDPESVGDFRTQIWELFRPQD